MDGITWIVAFRNKETHQVVGPVWFLSCKSRPTRWAKKACYPNCEYVIMGGQDYGYDTGVPDSVLQRQQWHDKEVSA